MSNAERPEFQALSQLEETVRLVTEELSGWRVRAHRAEAQRDERESTADAVSSRTRLGELESENRDLEKRLKQARARVSDLLMRLRFLEEQAGQEKVRS